MINSIKWTGTALLLVTAFLTSLNIFPANIAVGVAATVMLGYVSFKQKDTHYLIINGAFLFLNLFGLWNYYYL